MEKEVWKRQPRDEPGGPILKQESDKQPDIVFSAEVLALKKIMDEKLKCQNFRDHKFDFKNGKWMVNLGGSKNQSARDERHRPDDWRGCSTCNR